MFFEKSESFPTTFWENLSTFLKSNILNQRQKKSKVEGKSLNSIKFSGSRNSFKKNFNYLSSKFIDFTLKAINFQWYFLIFRLSWAKFSKVFDFWNILFTVVWYTWIHRLRIESLWLFTDVFDFWPQKQFSFQKSLIFEKICYSGLIYSTLK